MAYTVLSKLGAGAFGTVYQVRFPTRKEYAVKWVSDTTDQEAKLMKDFSHPHIVDCFSYYATKDRHLFMVLLFCPGGTLREVVRTGRVSESQALPWFSQMADAIKYIHSNNVWHRDLKPENILLDGDKNIKIGDLGIAKLVEATISTQGMYATMAGTPVYMSPEQLENHKYNEKIDIWSLGCVFFELLTKRGAFVDTESVVKKPPPVLPKEFSQGVQDLVKEMLIKNHQLRASADWVLTRTAAIRNIIYSRQPVGPKEEITVDWPKLTAAVTSF